MSGHRAVRGPARGQPAGARAVGGVWAGVAVLVERDVVRHVGLGDLLVGQQRVAGGELRVPGHEHGRHHGGLHPLVVVRVDADLRREVFEIIAKNI